MSLTIYDDLNKVCLDLNNVHLEFEVPFPQDSRHLSFVESCHQMRYDNTQMCEYIVKHLGYSRQLFKNLLSLHMSKLQYSLAEYVCKMVTEDAEIAVCDSLASEAKDCKEPVTDVPSEYHSLLLLQFVAQRSGYGDLIRPVWGAHLYTLYDMESEEALRKIIS